MHDPFGRSRLPGDFSREGRVALLREAFDDLMAGRLPRSEARVFLAAGGMSWLSEGGDLARDFWRVAAPRGSHRRPEVIARTLIGDERQDSEETEN